MQQRSLAGPTRSAGPRVDGTTTSGKLAGEVCHPVYVCCSSSNLFQNLLSFSNLRWRESKKQSRLDSGAPYIYTYTKSLKVWKQRVGQARYAIPSRSIKRYFDPMRLRHRMAYVVGEMSQLPQERNYF
ncbi:hypothetical protein CH063_04339 [Colletotrichum higginsianum]|uniref:Uncharacterized protein n=1 Tax=Colletotrichum higginsianum (strain IMI 349063) TaxID=759273 RepID=H1UUY4_COLHI|nr:hypothetical protein CH063_04339 [Colletotrichum higginsianum]